jgi:hypothetical protein
LEDLCLAFSADGKAASLRYRLATHHAGMVATPLNDGTAGKDTSSSRIHDSRLFQFSTGAVLALMPTPGAPFPGRGAVVPLPPRAAAAPADCPKQMRNRAALWEVAARHIKEPPHRCLDELLYGLHEHQRATLFMAQEAQTACDTKCDEAHTGRVDSSKDRVHHHTHFVQDESWCAHNSC